MTNHPVDVLVIGAGPTGLTLALQLAMFGVRVRVIDRGTDRIHESRALAIQARTLEVLAGSGVTDELVERGNKTVRLRIHAGNRETGVPLFDLGLPDTAHPYLLFLSQAETERILDEHLTAAGVRVERGVELADLTDDAPADAAVATLRHPDGSDEPVPARYLVGCDGAHSTVRRLAGIGFTGAAYPQTFVLADLEADGVAPGAAHAFLSGRGMLFFFPLQHPATWRILAMRPPTDPTPPDAPVALDEVQTLTDTYTGGAVHVRDPVWMTNFRLHHRAARYRAGRVFLAGDAAHIHSPAGAQGMNTGIQDAVNLAWKLAHALRGVTDPALLDSYHTERAPVGRTVLRFTDRAFTIATSTNPIVRTLRTQLAPALIPLVLKPRALRAYGFRILAQLAIRYRHSPLSLDGPHPPRHGPKAGDRLPDAPIVHNGQPTTLHRLLAAPGWHLLLCGPAHAWTAPDLTFLAQRRAGILTVHQLTPTDTSGPDGGKPALHRLGLTPEDTAQYLIRPDGHIGYRACGTDLTALTGYLNRWLPVSQRRPEPTG
jgi:2-polyprenyl-6-methoxyphenol hydroxylase-like FAD-dependent oxidoreductase